MKVEGLSRNVNSTLIRRADVSTEMAATKCGKWRQIQRGDARHIPTTTDQCVVAFCRLLSVSGLLPGSFRECWKGMVSNSNDGGFRFQKAARDDRRMTGDDNGHLARGTIQ